MAHTQRSRGQDEKREQILAAARTLFLEEGYEGASISCLSAATGLDPDTLYWYFKDKDEILVGVLEREFAVRVADYLQLSIFDPTERLLWVVNQFEQVSRLVRSVFARSETSPLIQTWRDRFHDLSEDVLRRELEKAAIAPEKLDAWIKICVFSIEGMLAHPVSPEQKRAICALLASA